MSDTNPGDILDANDSPLLRERSEDLAIESGPPPDLSGIRAIYFDLDDTLCAYWDASKAAMRTAFAKHGPEGITPEEMVIHWADAFRAFAPQLRTLGMWDKYLETGEPTRTEQMRRTLALAGVVDEDMAAALSETYRVERNRNLRLFSDAIPVLDILFARYPLGLITNGPADIQRQEVETLGIAHYFKNIYIEGEMKQGKPHPDVFARAAEAVGCEAHEVLMVGNSFAHDVRAALENGWHAIWVRRASDVAPSSRGIEEMPADAPVPDAVIQHLTELLPLLKVRNP